jgi:hypothetical protein
MCLNDMDRENFIFYIWSFIKSVLSKYLIITFKVLKIILITHEHARTHTHVYASCVANSSSANWSMHSLALSVHDVIVLYTV